MCITLNISIACLTAMLGLNHKLSFQHGNSAMKIEINSHTIQTFNLLSMSF